MARQLTILVLMILFSLAWACSKKTSMGNMSDCINKAQINPDAVCTMEYKPVCGCNEKTYSNSCMAFNAGVMEWKEGACPE